MSPLRYSGPPAFYKELAELPVPISAKFTNTTLPQPDFIAARVSYQIRDHERYALRSITKAFTFGNPDLPVGTPVIPPGINYDPSDIVALLSAPSERRHALLREVPDISGIKKRYVEVWSGSQLEASLEVTKVHGSFHTDGMELVKSSGSNIHLLHPLADCFKSFSFAPSETALVYTAEANQETTMERNDDPFPKFRFVPHFGEQLYTRKRPTIFLFRWRPLNEASLRDDDTTLTTSVTALSLDQPPNIPVAFGQATFVTDTRLYATGYEQSADGKQLGIKYCLNRPSAIWELLLPDEILNTATTVSCESVKIEVQGRSCRSPRVLFDEDRVPTTLFWLSNPLGGAHASTASLHARDLKGNTGDRILVDAVYDPSPGEFPGLYIDYNMAENPFLKFGNKTYILAQSLWRSRSTLVSIDVETGIVLEVAPDKCSDRSRLYSWNLLATDGVRSAICSRSSTTSPPETILLRFKKEGLSPDFMVLDRPTLSARLEAAISGLESSVIPIPDRYPVESIIIRSKGSTQRPKPVCLTYIHGGPHACSVTSFTPGVLAYALEGYTVSLPNYTGSTGFGEKYIQDLIGKCGTLDVADCLATVEELIRLGISEPGRQIVQGGSHGGFLTTHLIGQYPDTFAAAVVRNPVTSVGEIFGTSDIPDWAFSEFGLTFGPGMHITPESFAMLYKASPIAHVDRVKTPLLLLLGDDDLRVPPPQGRGYYHALKGRGRVVELLTFPKETHPLDGVEAAKVVFEAGRDWFRAFVQQGESS